MCVGDRFADGQTEPRTATAAIPRFVRPVEAVEDMRQVIGGNAGTLIGHLEKNRGTVGAGAHVNFPAGGRMLKCVGQEIRKNLSKALPISA